MENNRLRSLLFSDFQTFTVSVTSHTFELIRVLPFILTVTRNKIVVQYLVIGD